MDQQQLHDAALAQTQLTMEGLRILVNATDDVRAIAMQAAVMQRYTWPVMPIGLYNDDILKMLADPRRRSRAFFRRNEFALGQTKYSAPQQTVRESMIQFTELLTTLFKSSDRDVLAALPALSQTIGRREFTWNCEALGTYIEILWRVSVNVERWPCDAADVRNL